MHDDPHRAPRHDIHTEGDVDTQQSVNVSGDRVRDVFGKVINVYRDSVALGVAVLALVLVAFIAGHAFGARATRSEPVDPSAPTAPPLGVVGNLGLGCLPPGAERAAPAPPAADAPYPPEVRLAFDFERIEGLRVLDAAPHGLHGWLVGSFTAGDDGYAGAGLYFDGASVVCVPDVSRLQVRRELEISVRVRPALIDNRTRNIVARFRPGAPSAFRLYLRNGYPVFWIGGPGAGVAVESPYQLEAGRWHHLVARFDGERLQLFVDDHETTREHRGTLQVSEAWLEIGSTSYRNEFFIGSIDELVIRGR